MGCEFESKVKLDYIQDFEMMFEKLKVNRPREAAVYYVTLIIDCPKEFSDFLKVAEDMANITRRPLETGRTSLVKNGLIAKVLFSNDTHESFGRESYLPVPPKSIWENVKSDLKKCIAEDTFKAIENHLQNYNDQYKYNFKKYGIKLQRNGNVTIQYSGKWILYNLLNSCLENSNQLKMQIGGERFFNEPFIDYFKKFLELDIKIQLIVDTKINNEKIEKLVDKYNKSLDIRFFSEEVSGTLRNFVFGKEIAINGIKILPETNDEPSYVGTAYVDLKDIEVLDEKFNNMWELAKPI